MKTKRNEKRKNEMKLYERKQESENIKDDDIDLGKFFDLATTNKKDVNGLILHEIKKKFH